MFQIYIKLFIKFIIYILLNLFDLLLFCLFLFLMLYLLQANLFIGFFVSSFLSSCRYIHVTFSQNVLNLLLIVYSSIDLDDSYDLLLSFSTNFSSINIHVTYDDVLILQMLRLQFVQVIPVFESFVIFPFTV